MNRNFILVLAMGSISVFVVANVDWYLETMQLKTDVPGERLMCEWKYNPVPYDVPNSHSPECKVEVGFKVEFYKIFRD